MSVFIFLEFEMDFSSLIIIMELLFFTLESITINEEAFAVFTFARTQSTTDRYK
ncbi:hypothetical protein [Candidatus Liberibacter americanus]|uniref:hypothetical protein n=1 Tax=Candidatus Liberibacter americanus TaxID=309868 RepID=UPI001650D7D0|nr:hypothetical protein [Candidatus Liberibacter americanus]